MLLHAWDYLTLISCPKQGLEIEGVVLHRVAFKTLSVVPLPKHGVLFLMFSISFFFFSRTMVYYRWIDTRSTEYTTKLFFPKLSQRKRDFFYSMLQKQTKASLNGHGMGRHKKDEVYVIAKKDLQTLSDYLEAKPFVMGQEPTLVDASVFGYLAQIVWQDKDSPQHAAVHSDFKNLIGYCERMKERYWSDWDEAIAHRKKFHSES